MSGSLNLIPRGAIRPLHLRKSASANIRHFNCEDKGFHRLILDA
jgi:hypothetical protein